MKMYSSAPFVRELRRGREEEKKKRRGKTDEKREREETKKDGKRKGGKKKGTLKGLSIKKWPSEVVVLMKINLFVSDH